MKKRNDKKTRLEAKAEPSRDLLIEAEATFDLVAEAEAKTGKRPTFAFNAYNGGPLNVGFGAPIYVDLATAKARKNVAALLAHDHSKIVGQGRAEISATGISMSGTITSDGEPAQTVIENAKNGFAWGASIGASIGKFDFVNEGSFAKVNGREVKGPAYIARHAVIGEVSFVAVGADEKASAKVAARLGSEDIPMTFEKWLEAQGWDIATLTEPQKKTLRASYDAEHGEEDGNTPPVKKPTKPKKTPPTLTAAADTDDPPPGEADPVQVMRLQAGAEATRIAEVSTLYGDKHPALKAKAIAEGWPKEKAEYELKLADISRGPAAIIRDNAPPASGVLEAAVVMQGMSDSKRLEAMFDEKTLEAADKFRRMGWKALIQAHLAGEGVACPSLRADISEWIKAAFSTGSLTQLLGNSANKLLMDAFNAVQGRARTVAKKLTANDFKTHTGVRMINGKGFEKVGPGGELKHSDLSETSFTYAVDTYGKIISITRQQFINDDLGAFTGLPAQIGRDAALKVEEVFWALVIANTGTFFGTGNLNYQEGAATALGLAGLDTAVQLLEEMTDAASRPIGVTPKFLVVPPALSAEARRIFASDMLIATGLQATNARERQPATNTYKGLFEPIVVPQLKASTKVWYLFADPMDVAAFGIAYLNGVENPVVEDAALPSDSLGFAFRGYLDFGVCQIDKQGAIKSKGEA